MRNALISRLSLAGTALLITVAGLIAFVPQTVYAAGENWTITDANTISASGGEFSDIGTVKFAHQTDGSFTFRHVYQGAESCTLSWKITGLTKAGTEYTGTIATAGDCAAGQITGPIKIKNPSNVTLAGAGAGGTDGGPRAAEEDTLCDRPQAWKELNFWMCPLINGASDIVESLDAGIIDLLLIRTEQIFNTNKGTGAAEKNEAASSAAYFSAWSAFRNIAYALIVIIGLVMVASQVLGFEWFDAYTIRKMLPKLLLSIILVAVSWRLMEFLYNGSNAAASAIQALIKAPFANMKADIGTQAGDLTLSVLVGALLLVGAGAGLVALTFAGPGAIGALIVSGALVVFSAWIILITRNTIATLLIVASPVPLALYAFEPGKKVYNIWKTVSATILLSVPAVAGFLQISHVAALVTYIGGGKTGAVVAFIILVAAYGFIFVIIKKLDAVWGSLGNVTSQATGKLRGRLNNYASKSMSKRYTEGMEGTRNFGGVRGAAVGLGRRARVASQPGMGAAAFSLRGKSRAKYAEAVRTMNAGRAEQLMKQDGDRAGGDDTAMKLLRQEGMTEKRFLSAYAAEQMPGLMKEKGMTTDKANQIATERAQAALGLTQSSFGAQVGTVPMQLAAQKALLKSNTSYRDYNDPDPTKNFDNMTQEVYGDVAKLVQQGVITVADGAGMIKSNGARADRAGVGYGTAIQMLDQKARNIDLTPEQLDAMSEEVLTGTGPGQLIGQRHEAVTMMAPKMVKRAEQAFNKDMQETGNYGARFIQQIAVNASRRDMAGQLPEKNNLIYASGVEGKTINGRTISQWEEHFRSNAATPQEQAAFQEYRREYSNAAQRDQGQGQG
ncbi:MAG TPA: hypothetical protein VLF43_05270, partial [Candidatus Saccharimonadales bacterium]|nr:hypothetical protein [Candidatus Saccharimonadales bacterium]